MQLTVHRLVSGLDYDEPLRDRDCVSGSLVDCYMYFSIWWTVITTHRGVITMSLTETMYRYECCTNFLVFIQHICINVYLSICLSFTISPIVNGFLRKEHHQGKSWKNYDMISLIIIFVSVHNFSLTFWAARNI